MLSTLPKVHALQSVAEEGRSGAATLACVDVHLHRDDGSIGSSIGSAGAGGDGGDVPQPQASTSAAFLDVAAVGDCEVAVFRRKPFAAAALASVPRHHQRRFVDDDKRGSTGAGVGWRTAPGHPKGVEPVPRRRSERRRLGE